MSIQTGLNAEHKFSSFPSRPITTLSAVYIGGPAALIRALPFVEPQRRPLVRKFARLFLLQLADYQFIATQAADQSQVLSAVICDATQAIRYDEMTPELNETLTRQLRSIYHGPTKRNRCMTSARRLALKALDTCPIADALMMLEVDIADGIAPEVSHLHAIVGIALAHTGCHLLDTKVIGQ